jgi:hypothetical protein
MGSSLDKAADWRQLERFDPGVACARTFLREPWHDVAMNGLSVCPERGVIDDGSRWHGDCGQRGLPMGSADVHDLLFHL